MPSPPLQAVNENVNSRRENAPLRKLAGLNMTATMIIQSRLVETFPEINMTEKQGDSHLEMEGVLNIDMLSKCLAPLAEGNCKIEKLKQFLDDSFPQDHHSAYENFEKLTKRLNNIPVRGRDEWDNKDASGITDKQNKLVEGTSDTLRLLDNELRKDSLRINFSHNQFKRSLVSLEAQQAVSLERELTTGTSYADLWANMALAIAGIKSDYVDFYAGLMRKYLDMYQSYNKNVQKASSDALSTGEDGNSVKFDNKVMSEGYKKFNSFLAQSDLGKVKYWEKMSVEEQKSMGLTLEPAFKIGRHGEISFNTEQYSSINNEYPKGEKGQVPVSVYNAWLARFNSIGTSLQSNMQAFSSRYSQANSTYDTLNKVFSETISRMGDNARDFLK